MASVQANSQYGHPMAQARPGHARLPSIQNILSTPGGDSIERARDAAPTSFAHDPFYPAARHPQSDHVSRHVHPHQQSIISPASLATPTESLSTLLQQPSSAVGSRPSAADERSNTYPRSTPAAGNYVRPRPPSPYSAQGHPNYHTSPASSDYRSTNSNAMPSRSDSSRSPRPSHPRQMMPGVGECFLFPDGSILPCKINDEPVNPEFGVTKAGKPRKRLAQACITCREKKIKCQPGDPKCVQCEKIGRPCRRPPPQHSSKDLPLDSPLGTLHAPLLRNEYPLDRTSPIPVADKQSSTQNMAQEIRLDSAFTCETQRPTKVYDRDSVPAPKRQRSLVDALPVKPDFNEKIEGPNGGRRPAPRAMSSSNSFDLAVAGTDPFNKDPDIALEFLELYFEHRGRGPYSVFPRNAFIGWAMTCKTKTSDDIMLLCAVMAVGSRFTTNRMKRSAGQRFARQAAMLEREKIGELTLQLAQTRLYFLLYYFAEGNNALGWDYLSSGLSACNALNFNTEQGIMTLPSSPELYEYGFNKEQLIECRRRTFFAGYLMDRFVGHNSGHMGLVDDNDLFVRLPGQEVSFNCGHQAPLTPFFCEGEVAEEFTTAPGEMAMLVPLVAIWGCVVAQSYRAYHRPTKLRYLENYQKHWRSIYERIGQWEASLPEHLHFNAANTAAAVNRGCMNAYFVYHAIRFVTLIKLNRNADIRLLPAEMVRDNIVQTMIEANNLLSIVSELCRASKSMKSSTSADLENALSQPFPGYAVMTACDVLTSGGAKQNVPHIKQQLVDAKDVLEKIGRYWFAGAKQARKVERRLIYFGGMNLETRSTGLGSGFWRIPADEDAKDFFPQAYDLIHGSPDAIFYDAVLRVN